MRIITIILAVIVGTSALSKADAYSIDYNAIGGGEYRITITYDSIEDLIDAVDDKYIKNGLQNAGFSEDETIIEGIQEEIDNYKDLIPSAGTLILHAKIGSVNLIGLIAGAGKPPFMLGDTIGGGGDGYVFVIHLRDPAEETNINDLHVYALDPSNNTHPIKAFNWTTSIPPFFIWVNLPIGDPMSGSTPVTLNQVGEWKIVADFTDDGEVVLTLDVTFQVVPESILGAVGVVAGSMAVLMAYRRKKALTN